MATPAPLMSVITSPGLRQLRRNLGALHRRIRGQAPTLHFFYQVDDPYSHLLLEVLPEVLHRYRVSLCMHLVGPPGDAAAPDRARLNNWSRRDASELAQSAVLPASTCAPFTRHPLPGVIVAAQEAMAALLSAGPLTPEHLASALAISRECWDGALEALQHRVAASRVHTDEVMRAAEAMRLDCGHYLSGMLYFESEWFWGIDRLHYLERRLFDLGLSGVTSFAPVRAFPALLQAPRPVARRDSPPVLHFFCSLRSPYTYLAIDRCAALAAHYDAELRLRFVLPMVMRGLPVPQAKRLYIVLDAKREAETLHLPFGRISDPVGAPTERGLAVLHRAIAEGRGLEFLRSFMRGVWAEGINAGSDAGLRLLATRAGLDARSVEAALADASWRATATKNRDEMLAAGLWGVPSFRVDDGPARWGQDRLWLVERDLQACP